MNEKQAKEKVKEGWLHVLVTFEILGKPAAHVDSSLKLYLDEIKKDDRLAILKTHIGKAEKRDDNFFSAFAEADIIAKDLDTLTWLAVNYTPATIEIVEPDNFELKALDLQNHFNDLLARLHTIGVSYKNQTSHLEHLKQNFTKLIHNLIFMSLAQGPREVAKIAKETTLAEKLVSDQLKILLKDKRVAEKKGVYSLP